MVALKSIKLTVDEYVKIEQQDHQKYEFHYGEIYAMSGGSIRHSTISGNIFSSSKVKLKGKSCKPFNSDAKISAEEGNRYLYPDVSIVCGNLETDNNYKDAIANPKVIVEVLSKSTAEYDKGKKFEFYRTIKSLEEYVLVSQNEIYVEVYKREKDLWKITSYSKKEDVVLLESINLKLTIAEIYDDINFDEKQVDVSEKPKV